MAIKIGDIFAVLGLDSRKFDKGLDDASRKAVGFADRISSSMTNALSFALGGFIQQGLNSITAGITKAGASAFASVQNYEGLTLSLESLIARQLRAGDSSIAMADALAVAGPMAQQLLGWVQKLAIASPFEDEDINKAVQLAGAYRFGVQETKQLTQALVDSAAAGNLSGQAIEAATRALGQMNVKGKVSQEELNQLTEAGFGTASTLERLGVTLDDVAKGSVSASTFIQAFIQQMAEESEGAAQRTMNSWSGLLSTISSMISRGTREFFTGLLEPVRGLLEALGEAGQSDALHRSLRALGEIAGNLVAGPLEWLTGKIESLPDLFERAASFIQQFRDEMAGLSAGDIMAGLPGALEQIQQNLTKTLDTLAQAHEGTLANLQSQIDKAGQAVGQKMAEIAEKYADKISDLEERLTDTAAKFQEQLTDLAEQHGKKRAGLEKQIARTSEQLEERLTQLKADHARRRRELVTGLMTAESEEQYLQIKAQIKAEDERHQEQVDSAKKAGDEQVSELRAQLDEENAEYAKQEARLSKQRDKALADVQKQLDRVLAEKAKEVAKVQEAYDQEVAALQARIDRENELYAQSVAEQKALAEQAQADAVALANARAAALGSGPARELVEQVKAAIAAWNEFKTAAAEAWAEVQRIAGVFKDEGLGAGLSALAELVTQKLNEISAAINTWVNDPATIEQFRTWGRAAGQAMVDGIVSLLTNEGTQSVATGLSTALLNAWVAINMLPIQLATQFVQGFISSVTSEENIEALKTGIASALTQAGQWWAKTLAEWADGIGQWWAEKLAEWADIIGDFDWGSIGKNIVDGLRGGLEEKWSELTKWLSEKAAELPDWATDPLGIHSESKAFADRVGQWIPPGIQRGFEEGLPDLRRAIAQGMQSLLPTMPAPAALAGLGGTTNHVTLAPNFNLGQAPAGFDAEGLMRKIDGRMINLLDKIYDEG